jgi:hypothetical protein
MLISLNLHKKEGKQTDERTFSLMDSHEPLIINDKMAVRVLFLKLTGLFLMATSLLPRATPKISILSWDTITIFAISIGFQLKFSYG